MDKKEVCYVSLYDTKLRTKKTKRQKFNFDTAKGIRLDVGCGDMKQKGYVGLDIRDLPTVDIVHDMEKVPYPIPDGVCLTIVASHVVEHINPANFGFVKVMDEWHRIMKDHGRLMISMPYGYSRGFLQDPTHCNPRNEATWGYFDPTHRDGLWSIYKPRPWKILLNSWHVTGNMEVVLEKMPESDVLYTKKGNDYIVVVDKKWADVKSIIKNSDK